MLDNHLIHDLNLKPSAADQSLHFHFGNEDLAGINGTYVDDVLPCDTSYFEKIQAYLRSVRNYWHGELPITFASLNIHRKLDSSYSIDKLLYHRKLEHLPATATFSAYRSMRMKLAWIINTRPDVAVDISQLAQITEDTYIKESNSAV